MKNETALVEELKTYSKSELITEVVLLNDEVNGLWKTKERYKKMLKDSGVWTSNGKSNALLAANLKGRIERLQARLDRYENPTDISEVDLNG